MALSRLANWLRSLVERTSRPVGLWTMRTAVSTLFTFCPPLPPEREYSISNSAGLITKEIFFFIGSTATTQEKDALGRFSMLPEFSVLYARPFRSAFSYKRLCLLFQNLLLCSH